MGRKESNQTNKTHEISIIPCTSSYGSAKHSHKILGCPHTQSMEIVCFDALCLGQLFFSYVGSISCLPGLNKY